MKKANFQIHNSFQQLGCRLYVRCTKCGLSMSKGGMKKDERLAFHKCDEKNKNGFCR